jgi:hypothetical protein
VEQPLQESGIFAGMREGKGDVLILDLNLCFVNLNAIYLARSKSYRFALKNYRHDVDLGRREKGRATETLPF